MRPKIAVLILCGLLCLFSIEIKAQVGIGTTTPHESSILDIKSSNSGVLLPRIALDSISDTITIPNPETSLLIYNTSSLNDVTPGFYYWNGNNWNKISEADKVFGEIYKSSYENPQPLSSDTPIDFGSTDVSQGVVANTNNFQIVTSGFYRVTCSISTLKTAGNPINLGFYLATGFNSEDKIEGSFIHTRLDEFREISAHMNKIIHLNMNQKIYFFPDITNNNVVVRPNAATMNIELIKAD